MAQNNQKVICIRCPRGCEIITSLDGYGHITEIQGNHCKLGEDYVKNELIDPKRILTTTVRVKNGNKAIVPVWTENPVPKKNILELADALRKVSLEAPVQIGQVVLPNALGLGVDVITSGEIEKIH